MQAEVPSGTWNLPRPGIEPVSPALAGDFLTTGPPERSEETVNTFLCTGSRELKSAPRWSHWCW